MLKDQLQSDLTVAMRAHDKVTSGTLRMALTAVTNAEVSGKEKRELTDDDVVAVLIGEAKRRREAAESYDSAGAVDRANLERAELEVLERYLPAPLTDEEVAALVRDAVAQAGEQGLTGMKAMGAVMKVLTPATRGKADGGVVAQLVKDALGA